MIYVSAVLVPVGGIGLAGFRLLGKVHEQQLQRVQFIIDSLPIYNLLHALQSSFLGLPPPDPLVVSADGEKKGVVAVTPVSAVTSMISQL